MTRSQKLRADAMQAGGTKVDFHFPAMEVTRRENIEEKDELFIEKTRTFEY